MLNALVIDDDKLARKGLISLVPWKNCGFCVVGDVANGKLALEFLSANHVDLAIVDLSMPVMNGLEFIKESKKLYPSLQYVVLSFHEDFDYVQNALRLGALDYISKLRMEEEDCTAVFSRIGSLMYSIGNQKPENFVQEKLMGKEEIRENEFREILSEWQSCRWVYDKQIFEKQKEFISRSKISLRQADRLMILVSVEVEKTLGIRFSVPFFNSRSEVLLWFSNLYKRINQEVCEQGNSSLLSVCVLKSVQYIRNHLTEHLKMESVAKVVNMSRSYFAVSFKSVTGYTFNTFIQNERIELAKQLLENNKVELSEIAGAVGYEDNEYFARIFHQKEGINCSDFAKQYISKRHENEEGSNLK